MQVYVRSDSVVSRVIAGETLIVPVRRGVGDLASIYSLNAVGTAIWDALSSPRCKEEIIDAVEREFAAERTKIERDIEAFLNEMHSADLLKIPGAAE